MINKKKHWYKLNKMIIMEDLIEALKIFLKYSNGSRTPLHCEHDCLHICDDINPKDVSKEDVKRLDELGFFESEEDGFISFRFGSC